MMDMLNLVSEFVSDQSKMEQIILNSALDEDLEDNREECIRFNLEYQIFLCQKRQAQLQEEMKDLKEQIEQMKEV